MPGSSASAYGDLVTTLPPRPIRSRRALAAVELRIGELLTKPHLSAPERDYLEILGTIVEAWETEHEPIPRVGGVEVLKYLMAERELRNKDLTPIFRTESIVSEVLAGKRPLQARHIQDLAEFFGLSPEVFFPLTRPQVQASGSVKGL